MALARADDGFHPFGADPLWSESWYFDWATADGSLTGFARQAFLPNLNEIWFWLYLVFDGRVIAVRDHHVPLTWAKFEHRAGGLWWDFRPQEPLVAWSLQAECLGIEVDEPSELLAAEVGRPVPVGLDISFEAIAPPYQWMLPAGVSPVDDTPTSRFEQFGHWTGDILIGSETLSLNGFGERDHSWGRRDWWGAPWVYTAFHTGPEFAAHAAGTTTEAFDVCDGFVWRDGALHRVTAFGRETVFDDDRLPATARYHLEDEDGGSFDAEVDVMAAVPVTIEERAGAAGPTLFRRGPARFTVDGNRGYGDVEYNSPLAGPWAGDT
jgi:hypothetical protein